MKFDRKTYFVTFFFSFFEQKKKKTVESNLNKFCSQNHGLD